MINQPIVFSKEIKWIWYELLSIIHCAQDNSSKREEKVGGIDGEDKNIIFRNKLQHCGVFYILYNRG